MHGREMIDKLFLHFTKHTLLVKKMTSTTIVLGETGQLPPSLDCFYNTVELA